MAFRKAKAPKVPLTNAQQAERHLKLAEQYLTRSKKAGRIEYHVQLAATANTHATLALFYQNADPSLVIVQGDVEDIDEDDEVLDGDEYQPGEQVSAEVAPCCSKAGANGRHYGPCADD
jgi:hypothetical protein